MAINSSFSELAVTTIERRSRQFANNVEEGNALLAMLQRNGNIRTASGGNTILEEVDLVENGTFQYYSGYEVLDTSPSEVLTTSQWDWKLAAVMVSVSGYETEVVNAGPDRQIELLGSRIRNAERSMRNNISTGIYSDGTGSSGKQITGLDTIVHTTGVTTVAGINATTYGNWANQFLDEGDEISATNIQAKMNTLYLSCTFGNESPNLIVTDGTWFGYYWSSLQSIQRIADTEMGTLGFRTLAYAGGVPVVYENAGITANRMYMLNTNFLHWRPHVNRNMVSLGERKPVNQDAMLYPIGFAGNLTCSGRRYQGVMFT